MSKAAESAVLTPVARGGTHRLPSIQVLRGFAAAVVVFHHFWQSTLNFDKGYSWIDRTGLGHLGSCGVDIFFVISGFIMVYTTMRKAGPGDALDFLHKRVTRIYPTYWFWSTVLLALWLVGFALKSHHFHLWFIIGSYLLIPVSDTGKNFLPFVEQGWTLSFEMLFYVVFSCAILFRIKGWMKLPFLAVCFVGLGFLGHLLPATNGIGYLFSNLIIVEFLYGVLAGLVLLRLPVDRNALWLRALPPTLLVLGIAGLLLTLPFHYPDAYRFLAYGIPSLSIVFGAAMLGSAPRNAVLVYLGDASYTIYLTHSFFGMAYEMSTKRFSFLGRLSPDLTIVVGGVVTIALSSLLYPLVEKQLTRALTPARKLPRADAAPELLPVGVPAVDPSGAESVAADKFTRVV